MIVSPPSIIGTDAVAAYTGLGVEWVSRLAAARDPRVMPGYLGKIAGKHCWNAAELLGRLFTSDAQLRSYLDDPPRLQPCSVTGCGKVGGVIGLCWWHLCRFGDAWLDARRSAASVERFVAMCRWVVAHHPDVAADLDPWSQECASCGADTIDVGPLCAACIQALADSIPP